MLGQVGDGDLWRGPDSEWLPFHPIKGCPPCHARPLGRRGVSSRHILVMRMPPPLSRPLHRRGMTLVEVMVAIVILTVSVYMLTSTVTAAIGHSNATRERGLAVDATMNLFERMRAESFEELYARYNSDPNDDPDGAGTAPGKYFNVEGLDLQEGDLDGFVGEVLLPVVETKQGLPALRENSDLPEFGLPRDLNGDLMIDGRNHAEDYIILPVKVRIAWKGGTGNRTFEMSTMFSAIEKVDP